MGQIGHSIGACLSSIQVHLFLSKEAPAGGVSNNDDEEDQDDLVIGAGSVGRSVG